MKALGVTALIFLLAEPLTLIILLAEKPTVILALSLVAAGELRKPEIHLKGGRITSTRQSGESFSPNSSFLVNLDIESV